MAYANFISTDYIYKYTIIDNNVDPSILEPFIRQSQDIHIQEIIGNSLYVKLMNDISSNTLSGYYKTLVDDYIQQATCHWVVYECLPFINYRLTNKAISEKNSDNSTVADLNTVKYLRDVSRDKAEFYNQRIRQYILNNQQYLPEYSIYDTLGSIKPKQTTYFGGVYLKGTACSNNYLPGSGFPLN